MNADGITQIYTAPYAGGLVGPGGTIPGGNHVGFEELFGGVLFFWALLNAGRFWSAVAKVRHRDPASAPGRLLTVRAPQ